MGCIACKVYKICACEALISAEGTEDMDKGYLEYGMGCIA